jgi:Ser/Thr protein kinase RdoA (MazF antagonist)
MGLALTAGPRAIGAAAATASDLGLDVERAVVLQASNRSTLRLLPADVVARVALTSHGAMQLEVDLAQRLAHGDSRVATLDPRVPARVHQRDGFAITLWSYYDPQPSRTLAPDVYADALLRLHQAMKDVDLPAPHFLDRVNEAQEIVENRERSPALRESDRSLLTSTLATVTRAVGERGATEQLLHGEPHPGNVLNTRSGPRIIDLETACRGPVEFDLAHVPEDVAARYPNSDAVLLGQCRGLVLAMVAAWRLEAADQLPNRERAAADLLAALRAGPPYPTLERIRRKTR